MHNSSSSQGYILDKYAFYDCCFTTDCPRQETINTIHGRRLADDYAWLREKTSRKSSRSWNKKMHTPGR